MTHDDVRAILAEAALYNAQATLATSEALAAIVDSLNLVHPNVALAPMSRVDEVDACAEVEGEMISHAYSARVIEFANLAEALSPEGLDKMFDLAHALRDEQERTQAKDAEKHRSTPEGANVGIEKAQAAPTSNAIAKNPKRFRGNVTLEKLIKFVGEFEEFNEDTARKTWALLNDAGFQDFVTGLGVEIKAGANGGILQSSVQDLVALDGFGTRGWYAGLGPQRAKLLRAVAK